MAAREELTPERVARLSTNLAQQEFYDAGFALPGSFGVRVSRSGRRVFFLVFQSANKRRRATLGTYPMISLAEARERALAVLKSVDAGKPLPYVRGRTWLGDGFEDVARSFMEQHVSTRCSKKTAQEYRRLLEQEILPFLSERPIGGITASELAGILDDIAKTRKRPVLAQRVRALLSRIFSYAIDRGLIAQNLLSGIRPPRAEAAKQELLAPNEMSRLLRVLEREPFALRAVVELGIFLGARISALAGLRWQDIRPEYVCFTDDTSKIRREIFLVSEARALFRQLAEDSRDKFVFPGGEARRLGDLRRQLQAIGLRAGIKQHCSALIIRRSVEAGLYQLRIRPDVIDYIMGRESSPALRRNIAAGFDYRKEAREALSKWAQLVRSGGGARPPRGDLKLVE